MSNSGQPEIIDLVSDSEPEEEEENGNTPDTTAVVNNQSKDGEAVPAAIVDYNNSNNPVQLDDVDGYFSDGNSTGATSATQHMDILKENVEIH